MKTFPQFALILLLGSLAVAQVKITTTSLPEGTVKTPYSAVIDTRGGQTPFKWSSVGLPAGLKLKPSGDTRSATLTGTPTKPSTHQFDVSVEGHAGHMSTVDYTLTILGGTSHSAALTWKAGTKNIAGYNLYRSTTSGGSYSQINSSLLSANSYTDSNVADGTTYYYVATEVDNKGDESGYSDEAVAVIP
jgi:Putative Ig domain